MTATKPRAKAKVVTTMRLPDTLLAVLDQRAAEDNITRSSLVAQVLSEWARTRNGPDAQVASAPGV